MPQNLRAILGKRSRVSKPANRALVPPRSASASPKKKTTARRPKDGRLSEFSEKLDDAGISKLLSEDLALRDVVQAMRYIRTGMFSVMPETGFHSSRRVELLNYRISIPPLVTVGHLGAVLSSPSKVEREIAELLSKGVLRKVRVERRRGVGEAVIESREYERLISVSPLREDTKTSYITCLKENTSSQVLSRGSLPEAATDELVKFGFLANSMHATLGSTLRVRPEDRTTLTSIQHVSRFASGSVSAVGGQDAVQLAGGGGGGGGLRSFASDLSDFRIAVPGHGRYMKVAEGAVDWVRDQLSKTKWGEGTESWLKERFEGGGLYGTRWKEFWGVEWEWVLGEAVGLGVAELFDTGSVGRGVRALGN